LGTTKNATFYLQKASPALFFTAMLGPQGRNNIGLAEILTAEPALVSAKLSRITFSEALARRRDILRDQGTGA